jgi:hypothetical protein
MSNSVGISGNVGTSQVMIGAYAAGGGISEIMNFSIEVIDEVVSCFPVFLR